MKRPRTQPSGPSAALAGWQSIMESTAQRFLGVVQVDEMSAGRVLWTLVLSSHSPTTEPKRGRYPLHRRSARPRLSLANVYFAQFAQCCSPVGAAGGEWPSPPGRAQYRGAVCWLSLLWAKLAQIPCLPCRRRRIRGRSAGASASLSSGYIGQLGGRHGRRVPLGSAAHCRCSATGSRWPAA